MILVISNYNFRISIITSNCSTTCIWFSSVHYLTFKQYFFYIKKWCVYKIYKMTQAIGIDLGTTYSCVGVWQNDRVEIIANDQGNRTTPSYVAFTENNERLIGDAAKNQTAMNPKNTVFDAKRLIGRKFSDKKVQDDMKDWSYEVIAGPGDKPMINVESHGEKKPFSPEEISSMVLTKMKDIAESFMGDRKSVV